MKTAIALLVVALGAAIPLQGAAASGKGASDAALTTISQDLDLSAAKKKRVRSYVHVYPGYYGYHPYAFAPADPSWQSPELRRLRALNRCAIDLGYGRWENCD